VTLVAGGEGLGRGAQQVGLVVSFQQVDQLAFDVRKRVGAEVVGGDGGDDAVLCVQQGHELLGVGAELGELCGGLGPDEVLAVLGGQLDQAAEVLDASDGGLAHAGRLVRGEEGLEEGLGVFEVVVGGQAVDRGGGLEQTGIAIGAQGLGSFQAEARVDDGLKQRIGVEAGDGAHGVDRGLPDARVIVL
jgi:hypothetical protein